MPSKRDLFHNAPDVPLQAWDAATYGDTRALVAAGFARTEVGWMYGRATLTPTSLSLPQDATVDEWEQIGQALGSVQGAIQWWIADFVLTGEVRQYGVKYERAMALTGLEYKTLANMVSVARKFESSRRRENLSFAHHAAVAGLAQAEQDAWLDRAAQDSLSVAKLKQAMRGSPVKMTKNLRTFRQAFSAVWKPLKAGQMPSREQVEELARWVEALKSELGA